MDPSKCSFQVEAVDKGWANEQWANERWLEIKQMSDGSNERRDGTNTSISTWVDHQAAGALDAEVAGPLLCSSSVYYYW
jgi:hypothetical protein